jgi:hypothetical protein
MWTNPAALLGALLILAAACSAQPESFLDAVADADCFVPGECSGSQHVGGGVVSNENQCLELCQGMTFHYFCCQNFPDRHIHICTYVRNSHMHDIHI